MVIGGMGSSCLAVLPFRLRCLSGYADKRLPSAEKFPPRYSSFTNICSISQMAPVAAMMKKTMAKPG